METAGEDTEVLLALEPPLVKENWHRMEGWYKATDNRAPLIDQLTIEKIAVEWVSLYERVPPPGENIPVSMTPFPID